MQEYVSRRKGATNDDWWGPRKYDRFGYDEDGYDHNGYDNSGYDREGFNRLGRDRFGRLAADLVDPLPWRGIDIETLPSQLTRQLLPHYSDWIVIDPEKTRYQHLGEKMRLFVLGKKGWEPASSLSCVALGQKIYALARRPPRRTFGGGGFFRPAPPPPPAAAVGRPAALPTLSLPPIKDTGEVACHTLDVEILPGVQSTEGRLILSGSRSYRIQRAVNADPAGGGSARFGNLEENGAYSLSIAGGAASQSVFERVPFKVLAQPGALRNQLGPIDEASRLFLLDHRLRGERPLLVAGWEAPQFGIFADGTGNNAHNDMAHETQAPTNVAKLHDLYPQIEGGLINRIYIEGIGTRTGEETNFSDLIDQAIARSFGERVGRAINQMRLFFLMFPLAPFGYVDLFGFSRGSAMARALVNAIHRLNATDPSHWGGLQVVVRFVGLFDTVGSVGMAGDNRNDNRIARAGMPGPIILDLHPEAARSVYHLTGQDERRANFPLSSIRGAGGTLPAHFVEETMPGAHADVGGGYRTGFDVVHFPPLQFTWLREQERDQQIAQALADYRRKYQVPGLEIEAEIRWEGEHQPPWRRSIVSFRGKRLVRAELAHVALERMHAAAVERGVPLRPLAELRNRGHAFMVPDELRALVAGAEKEGPGSANYDALYRDYIHHSHQYHRGELKGGWVEAAQNLTNTNAPNPDGRVVFANVPERGLSSQERWHGDRNQKSEKVS